MTSPPADLSALRDLLAAGGGTPVEHMRALAAARHALGHEDSALELELVELQFLRAQAGAGDAETRAALRAASIAVLRHRSRCRLAAAADDTAAPFDLAECEAEAMLLGVDDLRAACAAAIALRCPLLPAGARLQQEADERWAALATEDEDVPLLHKVLLLRGHAAVLRRLAAATAQSGLLRLGRRMDRAADDRELALRVERLLGTRGARLLETGSFVLLLVVLLLIVIDALLPLSAPVVAWLRLVDALICACFLAEFAGKLALVRNKLSWLLRNALTDLLPSIPAVLWLLPAPPMSGAEDVVVVRLVRLFRITWAARYVQALRPLLRTLRLLAFLVRGMDALVDRFAPLLQTDFVFFAPPRRRTAAAAPPREQLLHQALQREHELLAALPPAAAGAAVRERLAQLAAAAAAAPICALPDVLPVGAPRALPVTEVVEFLWSLRPEDLGRHLSPADLSALDRLARVLSAPLLRWLPIARRLCLVPLPPTPPQRVVALGRRVAEWLEGWQARLQYFADLQGIVTGPQILDRVGSVLVKASQRPAARLLLFGGLAMLLDLMIKDSCLSEVLHRIVGLPLLILGSICLVALLIGWWLKRLAGEATEQFRMTSSAHFASLMHLQKRRHQPQDLEFLAARVFRSDLPAARAQELLRRQLHAGITGAPAPAGDVPDGLRAALARTALLYLHFLDGALLQTDDQKTTEQLLANLSLENVRYGYLQHTRRDKKRLRRLRLDDGSILSGPYLWFRFITESVAVETAKRVTEYNRRCVPRSEVPDASADELATVAAWLLQRRDPRHGRTLQRLPPPGPGSTYRTTEFHVLDFLTIDPAREAYLAATFGDEVLAALRIDRRNMIREIFGTRPLERLPQHRRSFNAYRLYRARLSHGRVLLLPLYLLLRGCGTVMRALRLLRQLAREVLSPHLAAQQRDSGVAPFAAALRKIHRMKAPGLLEAMRLRVRFDPAYSGAPLGWSGDSRHDLATELERDLDFLHVRERERAELRQLAAAARAQVQELHAAVSWLPALPPEGATPQALAAGELAITAAWIGDRMQVRTLLQAERWRLEVLPLLATASVPGNLFGDGLRALLALLHRTPVDHWLRRHGGTVKHRLRANLRRAYAADLYSVRAVLRAFQQLPPGESPLQVAIARLRTLWHEGDEVCRDVRALRAVQALSVLDVRNYRDLVFRLGDYAADGESPEQAMAMP